VRNNGASFEDATAFNVLVNMLVKAEQEGFSSMNEIIYYQINMTDASSQGYPGAKYMPNESKRPFSESETDRVTVVMREASEK